MKYELNNYLKVSICAFICWLIPSSVWAGYDVEVDGIYYKLNNETRTAGVTCRVGGATPEASYFGDVIIPESFVYGGDTYIVTYIDENTFHDCSDMTSVTIPNSVSTIKACAFTRCTSLTSITFPSSVSNFDIDGDIGLFSGSTNLTNIIVDVNNHTFDSRNNCNAIIETATNTLIAGCKNSIIPNSVTSIGRMAFENCTGLTSVTIPNSVTSLREMAFAQCTGLTSVTIPNSVIRIGDWAFGNTAWYNNQPDGLIYINNVAYEYKGNMPDGTALTIRNGTVSISDCAFQNRTGLISVTIPNSVTIIGSSAFQGCSSLSSITIPNSVIGIGQNAFSGTAWINNQPDGLIYINNVAYKYKGITSMDTDITIRIGTFSITGETFPSCLGLTSVSIPNSVTSIGDEAFRGCTRLTSVEIPSSVTSIGNMAFFGCTGLTSIVAKNEIPAILDSDFTRFTYSRSEKKCVFGRVDKTSCTLYVPTGSKSAYENASGWNEFENIVEVEFDTDISTLDNAIYVEQTEGRIGRTKDISVKMKNDFDVRGFQFSMELPEGTTINDLTLNQDRMPAGITMNKVFCTENIDGNKINVVCALNDGLKTFTGNDGAIATVNVSFAEDMEEGTYPIYLTDASISDASAEHQLELSDIKATLILEDYVLGDTNGDGKVLVGDVIAILNYIVGFPSDNFNAKAADLNGDGKVLVGDVIAVLNIIVNL